MGYFTVTLTVDYTWPIHYYGKMRKINYNYGGVHTDIMDDILDYLQHNSPNMYDDDTYTINIRSSVANMDDNFNITKINHKYIRQVLKHAGCRYVKMFVY